MKKLIAGLAAFAFVGACDISESDNQLMVAARPPKTQWIICWDGSKVKYGKPCPAQPAPPPVTKNCPGIPTPIPYSEPCPPPPEPEPVPGGDLPSPSIEGLAPIASEFDINSQLGPAWGTGAIAKSAAPDAVGSFRFVLGDAGLSNNDCIVFPGQPGKSHLHQYYGSQALATCSYESLRKGEGLNTQNPLNRSGYWMPAMLDGKGNVVRPDYISIYYKRRPASDRKCSLTSGDPQAEGNCVDLPNGLRFIFGFDMVTHTPATGASYFNCDGPGATSGQYRSIPEASAFCPAGSRIGAVIHAPQCWDGKRLDSANHRDHVAYFYLNNNVGKWMCPATHPYVIPEFTLQAWYSVEAGDDLSLWQLSSDSSHPDMPHGSTFHADFFMAWDPVAKKMWHDNCINKLLSCSGGDLGNGLQMKGYDKPVYGWKHPQRLVPIP